MQRGMIKALDSSMVMNMAEWPLLMSPGYVHICTFLYCIYLCDQQLSRVLGNKNIFKIPDGVIYEAKCPIVQLVGG